MDASEPPAMPVPAAALAAQEVDAAVAFRRHYRFVWRVLACAGVPRAGLDDAVQDVFLTVHRRRRDYDGRAPLRHWLYGIARGVGRNHGRKALRAAQRQHALPEIEVAAAVDRDDPPAQEVAVAQGQARDLVARFVDSLSPEQAEVFTLVHLEGMAVPEIADMLGAPVNTVYSRLRLARERFEALVARRRAQDDKAGQERR